MKAILLVGFFLTSIKHFIQSITKSYYQNYGIRGVPLNWFKRYLQDCTQSTEVSNPSQILAIKNEVFQGSVLRPLLFILTHIYNIYIYSYK